MAHTSSDLDLPNVVNNFGSTTLVNSISNVDTSIELVNALALTATGGIISINAEIIKFATKSGNILNGCVRGIDGTIASSHTAGDTVNSYVVAHSFNQLKSELQTTQGDVGSNESAVSGHVSASSSVHGVSGNVMGTIDAQPSENKTFDKMTYKEADNPTATGSIATVTPAATVTRLTNASLTGIEGIVPTNHKVVVLANVTGNSLNLINDQGTAANRVLTGTGGDITIAPDAVVTFIYDSTVSKFRLAGGASGGGFTLVPADHTFSGTLASGKHYLFDLSGASSDVSASIEEGGTNKKTRVSVLGNQDNGYALTVNRSGSDQIYYDGLTDTSAKLVLPNSWMQLNWDGDNSYYTIDDPSTTFKGALELDLEVKSITMSAEASNAGPKIRYENQSGSDADAGSSTFEDSSGTDIYHGSNSFLNESGAVDRLNDSEEACGVKASKDGRLEFYAGNASGDPTERSYINPTTGVFVSKEGVQVSEASGQDPLKYNKSETVELDNGFDDAGSNRTLILTRTHQGVSITADGTPGHTSGSSKVSSGDLIPSDYRPNSQTFNTYLVDSNGVRRCYVTVGGTFGVQYYNWSGVLTAFPNTGSPPTLQFAK